MDVRRVCCKRAFNKDALVLARKVKAFYTQTGKCLVLCSFLKVWRKSGLSRIYISTLIHSLGSLSYDRSKASTKASSPHNAI